MELVVLPLAPSIVAALSRVPTATLTTVLLGKGLHNVWLRGALPLRSGQARRVGRVSTLRFVEQDG